MDKLKKILKNSFLHPTLSKIKNYKLLKQESIYNEIFSNTISGFVVVELENIEGSYELDLRSDILKRILLNKSYEPNIVNLIKNNIPKTGDAINIGANIGLFANLLAQKINLNNKVVAVEPTENAYKLLLKNIERNKNSTKIRTFKGVITDEIKDFKINIVEGKEEYSSIGNLVHEAVKKEIVKTETIQGTVLDDLVLKFHLTPKLIVIDVEGAEFKVLKGGIKTLEKYKPIIISELDDNLLIAQGTSSIKLIKFLEDFGYKVFDADGGKPKFPFSGNIIAK